MRRVANRQPFVGLFARVELCVLTLLFQGDYMDAESSEVLGGFGNVVGGVWGGEGEFGEGRGSLGRGGGIVNVVGVGRAVW